MPKISLCIDIDNVLVDTDKAIRRIIKVFTEGRVQLDYDDIKVFEYYNCSDADGQSISKLEWEIIHNLFTRPENILALEPYSGVQDHLYNLTKIAELHFVTSRPHLAIEATKNWLVKHRFPMHELHFTKLGDKHKTIKNFDVSVEDHYEQAKRFAEGGTLSLILRHPWNESRDVFRNILWVDNWDEVTSIIDRKFPSL